jgi:L-threonylcarbamoyladenylate synthase
MTRLLHVDPDRPDPAALAEAADVIRAGGTVAFATETVYGLGADATNPQAVSKIFEAKGRPATNPLIVHVDGIPRARTCVSGWPDVADQLARGCWPGPLTLILPRSPIISDLVTAGRDSVGVRVPATAVALALIGRSGKPIAAPSANRSNRISPTRAEHVRQDLDGRIDMILDSGPTRAGIESTVLDLTTPPPYRILRPGPIIHEELVTRFGLALEAGGAPAVRLGGPRLSPGLGPVHYAPRTRAIRLGIDQVPSVSWPDRAVLIVVGPHPAPRAPSAVAIETLADPAEAAARFYDRLHHWDASGVDLIAIVPPPDEPNWRALLDRIIRATKPA